MILKFFHNGHFTYLYRILNLKIDRLPALAKSAFASPLRGLIDNSHILLTFVGFCSGIQPIIVDYILTNMIQYETSSFVEQILQPYYTFILNIGKLTAPVKLAFSSPLRGLTENSHILLTLVGVYTKIQATGVDHMLTKMI